MQKVSVVIPCYNSGEFLNDAVVSVQQQTYSDIEIIIVNDGSNDDQTLSCLNVLKTKVIVIDQENKGLPAARNTGIRHAAGKYILPLDSDDIIEPNCIEKLVASIENNNKQNFSYSYLKMFGDKSGVLKKKYNYFVQLFLNQVPYCMLIDKDIFNKIGCYDERMRNGYEDWEFNIRLGANGYYGILVPEALFNYRVSRNGMFQSISQNKHASLWTYIQNKHANQYKIIELLKIFKNSKDNDVDHAQHHSMLLISLFMMHKIFPSSIFNSVYAFLQSYSTSNRMQ